MQAGQHILKLLNQTDTLKRNVRNDIFIPADVAVLIHP
jgi:hypothetical protein